MSIRIKDYNYPLPDERIAKFPLAQRDHSKLLVYRHGEVSEDHFFNLPQYLPKGALMVFNNTKVIQARLHFRKTNAQGEAAGALIEVFLLEPAQPADYEQMFQSRERCSWYCLVGNLKKWKEGPLVRTVTVGDSTLTLTARRLGLHGTSHLVEFSWSVECSEMNDERLHSQPSSLNSQPSSLNSQPSSLNSQPSFAELLDAVGELPIPPYLNRETQESDKTTYQTVYSKIKGSVAAPTAGLHFTPQVLADVDAHGIDREELTLHVGAGTFKPVKCEDIAGHEMHVEYISVRRQTIEKLLAHDCQAIAVGTTSVRTLESLYWMGCKLLRNPDLTESELTVSQWEPYGGTPQGEDGSAHDDNANREDGSAHEYITRTDAPSVQSALEALLAWYDRSGVEVLHSATQIIIVPGYDYKIVKLLVTNFPQPQSTLLLLVSAFVHGDWHRIYDYALAHDFRFLSYGDSSLLIP